jgi:acyl carrier protein
VSRDTEERVLTVLASACAVDRDVLTDGTALRDELGADSLAIADVLATLEQQLAVELPDSDTFVGTLLTVGDVVRAFQVADGTRES